MNVARVKLRGGYAIAAGIILLVGIPLIEGELLRPGGYERAIEPIAARHDFAPLLAWVATNGSADRALRLVELVPFLLLLSLPPVVAYAFWDGAARDRQLARGCGQAGFAAVLLSGVIGMLTSALFAARYAAAPGAAARAAAASGYLIAFSLEALLARVVGGLLVAVFLALVSLRVWRADALPRWMVSLGLLAAALQALGAVFAALDPLQVGALVANAAYFALGLWVALVGVALVRIVIVPADGDAGEDVTSQPEAAAAPMDGASTEHTPGA